jgi:hypothetical protein
MNYEKIYNQIIEKARAENRIKGTSVYYEKHYIVPKCLGGSNKKEKIKNVTYVSRIPWNKGKKFSN